MTAPKRLRPPTLSLGISTRHAPPNIAIELESPLEVQDEDDNENAHLSSSPSSGSSDSPIIAGFDTDSDGDELSKDLAVLDELRRSVKQNLRLRPIKSSNSLPKVKSASFSPPGPSWRDVISDSSGSPASSTASSSVYYTPTTDFRSPPSSAFFVGNKTPNTAFFDAPTDLTPRVPSALDPSSLFDRLCASSRPMLIDTRPPASYLTFHIRHSVNIAIPSLILKRCRKPGGGLPSLDALRQFITTENGKASWDELMGPDGTTWDGDVIVYDEDMDEKNRDSVLSPAWALLHVCAPLVGEGGVDYLKGGIAAARRDHHMRKLLTHGAVDSEMQRDEQPGHNGKGSGLFQLDTGAATRSKQLPEIERRGHSPIPMMASVMHSGNLMDSTPSPPPSQIAFRRPPPPRRPSVPSLNRLDTSSAERLNLNLPKLQLRAVPTKSATLSVPPSAIQPNSPSHLNLAYSSHSPPGSARWTPSQSANSQTEFYISSSPSHYLHSHSSSPRTPLTPMPVPSSPRTARPEDAPPTTEEPFPEFTISTILPNFLYLGPELSTPDHVEALQALGVKRILNIAIECDDDQGLHLRDTFDRYVRIPMRDTVEEDNITRGVREACEVLDDARLHSAPTYVHCKAGKSRSVTAVMAYLIHANHWTLSRAYAFVLERRKGISPNIGFVSELMTFEEQELGGKSVGVVKPSSNDHDDGDHNSGQTGNYAVTAGNRRQGHVRESLPPGFTGEPMVPVSAGGSASRAVDSGQNEMEIKDASGRYRHARRPPVDETTLQPMRRVSKAGLESSAYS
ncbi:hypothetical protein PLICRDRAFT_29257 [Plicaturopsis crispa FD-325 SS-3]|nr:hypothetical protein PLICRDRAFT_29257 [Plicaturopsis crispa FD-325 SS-3]